MPNTTEQLQPKPIVLHILSGDLWGGAESQLLYQLTELSKTDSLAVKVMLFNQGITADRYIAAKLDCCVVPEVLGTTSLIKEALELAKSAPPAIVVSHGYKEAWLGLIIALLYKASLITTYHGAPETPLGTMARIKMATYTYLHRMISRLFAANIVTVSHALAKQLAYNQLPKTRVIYNVIPPLESNEMGITTDMFPTTDDLPAMQPTAEHNPLPDFNIVMVGRLSPVKQVDIAIETLNVLVKRNSPMRGAIMYDNHLHILGDGPLRTQLETLARHRNLSDNVHFLGFRKDARRFLLASDLLLMTSAHEGIPTVILERILSGKPFIAPQLPGIIELLKFFPDYPAILVPSYNPQDFADAILNIQAQNRSSENLPNAEHPHRYSEIIAKQFSPHRAAEDHLRIYRDLLAPQHNVILQKRDGLRNKGVPKKL